MSHCEDICTGIYRTCRERCRRIRAYLSVCVAKLLIVQVYTRVSGGGACEGLELQGIIENPMIATACRQRYVNEHTLRLDEGRDLRPFDATPAIQSLMEALTR